MSTGERLGVALALNRHDWLTSVDYSIADAMRRCETWLPFVPLIETACAMKDCYR